MNRRAFLRLAALTGMAAFSTPTLSTVRAASPATRPGKKVKPFELDEMSIAQLQDLMAHGKASAVSLVKKYQARIEAIDRHGPRLNAVMELNPDALAIAAALDKERVFRGARGPLHGVPQGEFIADPKGLVENDL